MNDLTIWKDSMETNIASLMKGTSTLSLVLQEMNNGFNTKINDMGNRMDGFEQELRKNVCLKPVQKNILQTKVKERVRYLAEKYYLDYDFHAKKLFKAIWGALNNRYGVAQYAEIPAMHYEEAKEYVQNWEDEFKINQIKAKLLEKYAS